MAHQLDPHVIAEACRDVIDLPLASGERLDAAKTRLAQTYPDLIDPDRERWIFTKAGGIVGKVSFLYASINEYLLMFGAPVATQGFSGRYNHIDIHKFILAGRYSTYDLETRQITPGVFGAGELVSLPRGEVRGMEIASGSWHLEYGRGPVVTAMPFGLVDVLVSSLEIRPLLQTTADYSRFLTQGLRRRLGRR
jgi:sigma non-opioid intracellular receptor